MKQLAIILEVNAPDYDDITLDDVHEIMLSEDDEENVVEIIQLLYADEGDIKQACFKALGEASGTLMLIRAEGSTLIKPEFTVSI